MFEKPVIEWKLDKDTKEEMETKVLEKYKENMKGEEQRIRENNLKLSANMK